MFFKKKDSQEKLEHYVESVQNALTIFETNIGQLNAIVNKLAEKSEKQEEIIKTLSYNNDIFIKEIQYLYQIVSSLNVGKDELPTYH